MKTYLLLILLLSGKILYAQTVEHPLIENFGAMYDIPEATQKPNPDIQYKIAVDFSRGSKGGKDINFSLDRVAKTMNLHYAGGVPEENMDVRVIAYAGGVRAFLSDEAHKKKHGKTNPNSELIEKLNDLGVTMMVCGQSLRLAEIDESELHPHVEVATSYITETTTAQLDGYVILHF